MGVGEAPQDLNRGRRGALYSMWGSQGGQKQEPGECRLAQLVAWLGRGRCWARVWGTG